MEDPGCNVKVCQFQFWSYSINNICHCRKLVIFTHSYVFGHVNKPPFYVSKVGKEKINNYKQYLTAFSLIPKIESFHFLKMPFPQYEQLDGGKVVV